MKKFIIKYETSSGDVKTSIKEGFDEKHVESKISYKEIYWIKCLSDELEKVKQQNRELRDSFKNPDMSFRIY